MIVYSGSLDRGAAERCIDVGATGFVSKGLPIGALLQAIDLAAAGQPVGIIVDFE